MSARWATFDCYGTLVDWRTGMLRALESVAGERAAQLLAAYHEFEHAVESDTYRPYREVMAESLRRAAAREGIAVSDEGVLAETLPSWPIFPDVGDGLQRLQRSGWRLAILSNVDRDLIAGTLAGMPVGFDAVITAEDVRSYKPAHAHFVRFQESTGAQQRNWAHVAGSEFHDIAPAFELAIRSIWIDRERTGSQGSKADVTLPDLRQLPETLERLVPAR